jgi:hypothetical protein
MVSIRDIDTLCRELNESTQYFCDSLKFERLERGEVSGDIWALLSVGVLEKRALAAISEFREKCL